MSEIADVSGTNVAEFADAIGCLPKDIRAFTARAEELGRGDSVAFLKEVDTINLRNRQRVVAMTVQALGKPVYRSKVAVLGHASSRTPTT